MIRFDLLHFHILNASAKGAEQGSNSQKGRILTERSKQECASTVLTCEKTVALKGAVRACGTCTWKWPGSILRPFDADHFGRQLDTLTGFTGDHSREISLCQLVWGVLPDVNYYLRTFVPSKVVATSSS